MTFRIVGDRFAVAAERLKREGGAKPPLPRNCERYRKPENPTGSLRLLGRAGE